MVIGCGNADRGDDAAGLLVARRLLALGVEEAIALGKALGVLPQPLLIYGIEGSNFAFGSGPSAEVLRAVEELANHIALEG